MTHVFAQRVRDVLQNEIFVYTPLTAHVRTNRNVSMQDIPTQGKIRIPNKNESLKIIIFSVKDRKNEVYPVLWFE